MQFYVIVNFSLVNSLCYDKVHVYFYRWFFFFLFVSSDRSSYGGPRTSLRRQLDHKDVYGYQCFYKKPPTGSITLQQFEAYAIERLKGQTTMIVFYWQLHFSQSTEVDIFLLFLCDIHNRGLMTDVWTFICKSVDIFTLYFKQGDIAAFS